MLEKVLKMMELYIETLTGTAFELRVSPYETIQDVKSRIQKLEGIPVSQQHLIWQSRELDDDYCLSDYSIHDGATLKLVLTMRGGPINTRRIPVEDSTLREMAEYFSDANRDEIMEKVPGNRPVTVIVYHNGDQFNFFRIVDRDSTSPMSESLSGASMYNLYDEEEDEEDEEEEDPVTKEQHEENDKTREKMLLLRNKMENMTLSKKPKKKHIPRPPSSGRPGSRSRLRRVPSRSGNKSATLNRNACLPPVGQTMVPVGACEASSSSGSETSLIGGLCSSADKERLLMTGSETLGGVVAPGLKHLETVDSAKLKPPPLASVKEDRDAEGSTPGSSPRNVAAAGGGGGVASEAAAIQPEALQSLLRRTHNSLNSSSSTGARRWDLAPERLVKDRVPKPPSSPRRRDMSLEALKESLSMRAAAGGGGASGGSGVSPAASAKVNNHPVLEAAPSSSNDVSLSGPARTFESFEERVSGCPHTSTTSAGKASPSKYASIERKQGVILESLNPSEVRAMSGMLSSLVRSASKSRAGFTLSNASRIPTPEERLMSARLQRLSGSRDGRGMSPSHRLPPVKQKKKSTSKRCFLCSKKTGLATSYQCRCGNNFCASHRLPEAHTCSFDYKTEGRKLLEQSNPVVTAPKLPKI